MRLRGLVTLREYLLFGPISLMRLRGFVTLRHYLHRKVISLTRLRRLATTAGDPQGAIAPMPQISADFWHFPSVTWLESARSVRIALEKRGAFPVK